MTQIGNKLEGIFPVIPSPLKKDQQVDHKALSVSLDYYLATDVCGLTILGSGGELPYFSDQEQVAIAKTAAEKIKGEKTLIIGVNAYSEYHAIEKINAIDQYADYIMLLLPSYYQYSFEDYKQSLTNIAKASKLPILYYHFPQVSGQYLSANELIEILNIDNVVGMKDSALHRKTAKQVLESVPNTSYFNGLSLSLPHLLKQGGAGAICPIAALAPDVANEFYDACKNTEVTKINKGLQRLSSLLPIVNALHLPAQAQLLALNLVSRSPKPLLKI